ncbi:hypothetical protein J2Z31_000177 [Sinorhizobium kostiense]|uniref:Spore protein YkvP/CgeB glycosyl transferase-like domain-containing protein n=1 Tax=Sinorhizobium kostiense TaxID=76747 RepID=A0ABS4QVS0_9HYPH|nr:glycosyltransferase [Sinorhizobium kostiense]MBP2233687.1 hypothetical protein [Sinorhizobium kostiense]
MVTVRGLLRSNAPRIALIADELTATCLSLEASTFNVTPLNYKWVLRFWRPDFLFVESAWQGAGNAWKYKIATYPDKPRKSNDELKKVIAFARDRGIPCVFWNKEDSAHFDRFINSASLFEYVFTVDENCLPKYRRLLPSSAQLGVLTFPVQTTIHNFTGFQFKWNSANFVGSYSRHIHDRRRQWQHMMFQACAAAKMDITVFDRNSGRRSEYYQYPADLGIEVRRAVPYQGTARIYKEYLVSLNVNTVDDSPSMYSRRLVEILACGGIAITNPSPSVTRFFKDYCYVVEDEAELIEQVRRLTKGPSAKDLDRAAAGAHYVREEHNWAKRLGTIMSVLG